MKNKIKIIILAAGKGTRMKSDEPKALTPLKGKPFIEHILATLHDIDPDISPIIVVGYNKERIKEKLGNGYLYAEQHEQLGTGHAVMSAKSSITGEPEAILVISADQPAVSKETLEKIIDLHLEKKPAITLATIRVPDFTEWRAGLNHFGRIIRSAEGAIEKIVEFKDANDAEKEARELNLALYAFDTKWLWENIDKIKNENTQGEYYLTDLIKIACDQNQNIETVQVANVIEAIHPNSKEELEVLEKLMIE
jgi:bifunctional UDP-N-acetylglucosamine pyrophosphorylase/glucosamine-1-phosphate N-acetyltransferase